MLALGLQGGCQAEQHIPFQPMGSKQIMRPLHKSVRREALLSSEYNLHRAENSSAHVDLERLANPDQDLSILLQCPRKSLL